MSMVRDTHQQSETMQTRRPKRFLGSVALGTAGLFLMSTAYQASFANQFQGPVASRHGYPHPGGGGGRDKDSGLSTGEKIGIGLGAAAGAALIYGLVTGKIGGGGSTDPGAQASEGRLPVLPAGHTRITELRLGATDSKLALGSRAVMSLEAKSAKDGKWYSVTERSEAAFELVQPSAGLVRMDGAKNVFCVPMTAPASLNGQVATVRGTFQLPGEDAVMADANLKFQIAGTAVAAR